MAIFLELSLDTIKIIFSYLHYTELTKISMLNQRFYVTSIKILLERIRTSNYDIANNEVKLLCNKLAQCVLYSPKLDRSINILSAKNTVKNDDFERIENKDIEAYEISTLLEDISNHDSHDLLVNLENQLNLVNCLNELRVDANISLEARLLLRTMSIGLKHYFNYNKLLPIKPTIMEKETVYLLTTVCIPQYRFLGLLGLLPKLSSIEKSVLFNELMNLPWCFAENAVKIGEILARFADKAMIPLFLKNLTSSDLSLATATCGMLEVIAVRTKDFFNEELMKAILNIYNQQDSKWLKVDLLKLVKAIITVKPDILSTDDFFDLLENIHILRIDNPGLREIALQILVILVRKDSCFLECSYLKKFYAIYFYNQGLDTLYIKMSRKLDDLKILATSELILKFIIKKEDFLRDYFWYEDKVNNFIVQNCKFLAESVDEIFNNLTKLTINTNLYNLSMTIRLLKTIAEFHPEIIKSTHIAILTDRICGSNYANSASHSVVAASLLEVLVLIAQKQNNINLLVDKRIEGIINIYRGFTFTEDLILNKFLIEYTNKTIDSVNKNEILSLIYLLHKKSSGANIVLQIFEICLEKWPQLFGADLKNMFMQLFKYDLKHALFVRFYETKGAGSIKFLELIINKCPHDLNRSYVKKILNILYNQDKANISLGIALQALVVLAEKMPKLFTQDDYKNLFDANVAAFRLNPSIKDNEIILAAFNVMIAKFPEFFSITILKFILGILTKQPEWITSDFISGEFMEIKTILLNLIIYSAELWDEECVRLLKKCLHHSNTERAIWLEILIMLINKRSDLFLEENMTAMMTKILRKIVPPYPLDKHTVNLWPVYTNINKPYNIFNSTILYFMDKFATLSDDIFIPTKGSSKDQEEQQDIGSNSHNLLESIRFRVNLWPPYNKFGLFLFPHSLQKMLPTTSQLKKEFDQENIRTILE